MPFTKKRQLAIEREAKEVAKNGSTVEESNTLEKDYAEIILALNINIEKRLDKFCGQALPILRDAYPSRPAAIIFVIKEEVERQRDLTQHIMTSMEPIKDPGFRLCAAKCVKDIVDICVKSIGEQNKRAALRAGIKPN